MPKYRVPEGTGVADLDVLGGLGLPAVASGIVAKVGKALTNPADRQLLEDLLGVPLQWGKRLLRLSSVEPDAGLARLHTEGGGRIAAQISELLTALKSGAIEEAGYVERRRLGALEQSPSQVGGDRIQDLTTRFGPRGGETVTKRRLPPKATR